MARKKSSRKYQITINNPIDKGYTHEQIKTILTNAGYIEKTKPLTR